MSSSSEESASQDEIDLENYFTKPEVEKFVSEIYDRFKVDDEKFKTIQEETHEKFARVQKQVDTNEEWLRTTQEFTKAVKSEVVEIGKEVEARQSETRERIELILKNHQREKSDLQNANMKLINRIGACEKKTDDAMTSLQSMCTVTLCLMESQCM